MAQFNVGRKCYAVNLDGMGNMSAISSGYVVATRWMSAQNVAPLSVEQDFLGPGTEPEPGSHNSKVSSPLYIRE